MVTGHVADPWEPESRRRVAELLEHTANGDRSALAELYNCLGPEVLHGIRRHLADPVEAGHALRAAFVGIWLMARHRPPPPQQRDWVTRMARRQSAGQPPTAATPDRGKPCGVTLRERITNEFHHLMGIRPSGHRGNNGWRHLDNVPAVGRHATDGRPLLVAGFDIDRFAQVRHRVTVLAERAGLDETQAGKFVLAVNEIASNVIRHGGGAGELYLWRDHELMCEIRDLGPGFDSSGYVNRTDRPEPSPSGGMGLWITQLSCAAMLISSGAAGTTSRIRAGFSPFAAASEPVERPHH